MDDLLPHFERELNLLRRNARHFSEKYPKIANRMQMAGENVEDPHIERLIQSFALLAARVHKKLDDEYPEFTDALFEVLYPHYLKPFPACSIAHFDIDSNSNQLTFASLIGRGSQVITRPVKGVPCKFRTAFDVWFAPLLINQVIYENVIRAPQQIHLPASVNGIITIDFHLLSEQVQFDKLNLPYLRMYFDADPAIVAQLRKAIFHCCEGLMLESKPNHWVTLPLNIINSVGFNEDQSLIDFDARSAPAYRLLTEFFAFPEKFNFLDLAFAPILEQLLMNSGRSFKLHFLINNQQGTELETRLLEQLAKHHIKLHCVPIVNLFKQNAEPIRLSHTQFEHPVVADYRRPYAFELYSVDSVYKVVQSQQGENLQQYRSFYSLKHGDSNETKNQYWHLTYNESLAEISPGFEYQITLVDDQFDLTTPKTETISLLLTCTNRDLPTYLSCGQVGGDLFMEGGGLTKTINLLRKPTHSWRFKRAKASQWRLVSHLSMNHYSLTASGGNVLRETLTLYNINASSQNLKMIDSIIDVSQKPSVTRMTGKPFPVFIRGLEIHIKIKEDDSFVGTGLHLFAQMLDHFFGMYVHANSFTQLVFISASSDLEILKCQPRNGQLILA